jgi:hypothetical protein
LGTSRNLFWSRDALPVVKELVGDESLAKDMKWAPEKLYNSKGSVCILSSTAGIGGGRHRFALQLMIH